MAELTRQRLWSPEAESAAVRTHGACLEDYVFVLKVMRTWLNSHFAKIVPARKEEVAGVGWGTGRELVDRLLGTLGQECWWLDQEGSTSCGVGRRQGDESRNRGGEHLAHGHIRPSNFGLALPRH